MWLQRDHKFNLWSTTAVRQCNQGLRHSEHTGPVHLSCEFRCNHSKTGYKHYSNVRDRSSLGSFRPSCKSTSLQIYQIIIDHLKKQTTDKATQLWWLNFFFNVYSFVTLQLGHQVNCHSRRVFSHSTAEQMSLCEGCKDSHCISSSTTVSTLGQSWACPQPGHNMPLESDCR